MSNSSNDSYQGYSAQQPSQPYGADEMPQSSYPQQDGTYYQPGQQTYGQEAPQPTAYANQGADQQQYGQQQQQQYYGQQQQYYGPQYGQPGAGNYNQGTLGDVGPQERTGMGMKARTAAMLSYLFGLVGGLVFLLLERENRFVRFHAMQSVLFFGFLSIAQWIVGYLPYLEFLRSALGIVGFVGWLFLFITANKGRYYKLPGLGDLAEQLLTKFR